MSFPFVVALLCVIVLAFPYASAFTATSPSSSSASFSRLSMVSSEQKTESLTSLTKNMLKAHQEMTKEMKVLETIQASDRSTAQLGPDGFYRIVNEEQYE